MSPSALSSEAVPSAMTSPVTTVIENVKGVRNTLISDLPERRFCIAVRSMREIHALARKARRGGYPAAEVFDVWSRGARTVQPCHNPSPRSPHAFTSKMRRFGQYEYSYL